jgi:predicted dehydrogenase/threonine dehydrogenase-like Zn-dependent dehydrogenase
MKQVLVRSGAIVVEEVPAPSPGPKEILVRVAYSCVSAGTELAGLRTSALPLYRRALKQPEHVRKAFEMIRDQGVSRTWERISGKLAAGSPTGYSAAGEIVEVGAQVEGFARGDRVACAGAGIANHAELISVPVNLAVHVPAAVELSDASTVTLGAIALQGVRRCQPTLGETVVVLGLGLLGQLTVQLLRANGCRVIGVDVNAARIRIAAQLGLAVGLDPSAADWVAQVQRHTAGAGADAVIVTASSSSAEVISQALRCCRRKGRVIVVGDVNLQIERADLYAKELDLLISTSYGPGRYDPLYEEGGQDYPLAYVRWTENRNMQAYLELLASGAMNLAPLRAGLYPIDRAAEAYEALKSDARMIAVLEYPARAEATRRSVPVAAAPGREGTVGVALVGAGGFAQGMHLPNLLKLCSQFSLQAVVSRTGATAKAVARHYGAAYATTCLDEVLADSRVQLIIIATRHDQHARMALAALKAGKHVFVEKPLAITPAELDLIEEFYAQRGKDAPLLMTGFNRRFSPAITRVRQAVRERSAPLLINYRVNAGYLPATHWVHGPEGGGRNIGEACHIYDVFQAVTHSTWVNCTALSIGARAGQFRQDDNFVVSARYSDGSLCTLTYTALGAKEYPKERMEVFCDGAVLSLDDYKDLSTIGRSAPQWSAKAAQKGQLEELQALATALHTGGEWPIPLADQLAVTRLSLAVEAALTAAAGDSRDAAAGAG